MAWWLWILLGVALLAVEIVVPGGFFVLFFGIGAVLVGVLAAAGLAEAAWLQWLLFSVVSVGAVALLRRRLLERLQRGEASGIVAEGYIGEMAELLDDLSPGQIGKAELRGTLWNVRSDEPHPLPRGQRCRVARVDGLVLWVRPDRT